MRLDKKSSLAHLFLVCVTVFFVWNGLRAIDFGDHWDEPSVFDNVADSVGVGILLPCSYNYPSLCYDIAVVSLAPQVVHLVGARDSYGLSNDYPVFAQQMLRMLRTYSKTEQFKLFVRCVFFVIAMLSVWWLYLASLARGGGPTEAIMAAVILGSSWEFSYHARWVAPDAILTQFAALQLVLLMSLPKADQRTAYRLLAVAAIVAGLGCGTKYPGALMMAPVYVGSYLYVFQPGEWKRLARRLVFLTSLFVAAYMVTTPGTLLDPTRFIRDVSFVVWRYSSGQWGYTVASAFEHFRLLFVYLGSVALSHYDPLAIALAVMAVVGAVSLVREDWRLASMLLVLPVIYIAYVGSHKVMIVRNYLILFPYMALFAALGICKLLGLVANAKIRGTLAALIVAVILLVNGFWMVRAADSITEKSPERFARQAMDYIDKRPNTKFWASERVLKEFSKLKHGQSDNLAVKWDPKVDLAMLYLKEVDWKAWKANRKGYFVTWFGPYEVNLDYYPSWQGKDRIVLLPAHNFAELISGFHKGQSPDRESPTGSQSR